MINEIISLKLHILYISKFRMFVFCIITYIICKI